MLIQTQDAINRLKAAGLKRHEFHARCERLMSKGRFRGYGDVLITLFCSAERQAQLAPRLAEHFRVVQYMRDGQLGFISVYDNGNGLTTENH